MAYHKMYRIAIVFLLWVAALGDSQTNGDEHKCHAVCRRVQVRIDFEDCMKDCPECTGADPTDEVHLDIHGNPRRCDQICRVIDNPELLYNCMAQCPRTFCALDKQNKVTPPAAVPGNHKKSTVRDASSPSYGWYTAIIVAVLGSTLAVGIVVYWKRRSPSPPPVDEENFRGIELQPLQHPLPADEPEDTARPLQRARSDPRLPVEETIPVQDTGDTPPQQTQVLAQ